MISSVAAPGNIKYGPTILSIPHVIVDTSKEPCALVGDKSNSLLLVALEPKDTESGAQNNKPRAWGLFLLSVIDFGGKLGYFQPLSIILIQPLTVIQVCSDQTQHDFQHHRNEKQQQIHSSQLMNHNAQKE